MLSFKILDQTEDRIDKLISKLSDLSRSYVHKLIHQKCLKINDIVTQDKNYIPKAGDDVSFIIPSLKLSELATTKMDLDIIYEDNHLLVINKQAGLTVHPGFGNDDDTLVNALLDYGKSNLSKIGGALRPGIVHRLDKDTSGLIIVAKNDLSHIKLSNQIKERHIKRMYKALVWGLPKNASDKIESYIGRSRSNYKQMQVLNTRGKLAITHYSLEKSFKAKASLIECQLNTGRTHQIRVHLTHIGNSVIGDQLYGNNAKKIKTYIKEEFQFQFSAFKRQALHAYKIGFVHPENNAYMEFTSNIPSDMQSLLNILEQF